MKRQFSHLTLDDRRQIERWRLIRLSPDDMAHRLGHHRSTILRELRRNELLSVSWRITPTSSPLTGAKVPLAVHRGNIPITGGFILRTLSPDRRI